VIASKQILLAGTLAVGAPVLGTAQIGADVVAGTRINTGPSQRGTLTLPNGEVQEVVLRERLRAPWLVGGARLSHIIFGNVSLELGYTGGLVNVSVDELDGADPPLIADTHGMIHTFALRPRVQLGRFGDAAAGHAIAGPVVVWRTGGGFTPYSGTLRGGWSIGLGAMLRARMLLFRADLEDVIYPLALRQAGVLDTRRTVRHDLLLTIGVALLHGRPPGSEP
jgi:hypothetical protein